MAFPHDYHRSVWRDFLDAVRTGGEPRVSLFWFVMVLMFAWNTLRILMAWQKSLDRPKPPIRRAWPSSR